MRKLAPRYEFLHHQLVDGEHTTVYIVRHSRRETRLTIERAESRKQAMALLLMSPEFQRR